jgi:hypothetical protein
VIVQLQLFVRVRSAWSWLSADGNENGVGFGVSGLLMTGCYCSQRFRYFLDGSLEPKLEAVPGQ